MELIKTWVVFKLFLFETDIVVFTLEELLSVVPPGPKVVLIKDDQIPLDLVDPFVIGLYQTRLFIPT